MSARALLAALAMAVLVPGIAAHAQARDLSEESLPDPRQEAEASALMDTIRCVVCQGQPISGSNADLAGDMRRLVRERIAAGDTPAQVRSFLVGRYGDWVSFKPGLRPATLPLWALPILALAGGVWLVLRRLKIGRR